MSREGRQHAGVVAVFRRRIFPMLARWSAVLGLAVLVQFVVGRICTDRFHATQYLWWVPALWSVLAMGGLLVVSAGAGRVSLRPAGIKPRAILVVGCMLVVLWIGLGEWRGYRVVLSGGGEGGGDAYRVVHWNLAAAKVREGGMWSRLEETNADLVLIANPRGGQDQRDILNAQAWMAPADEPFSAMRRYKINGQPGHFLIAHRGLVASRYPIRRAGLAMVGPMYDPENESRPTGEHGWAMFLEIDRGDPEPIVVWLVDMPSDPEVWRVDAMRSMRSLVDAWDGPAMIPGETGWDRVAHEGGVGFPDPDVVIGDFNTLRGSASLERFALGYRDAFEAAGSGWGRSWTPRVTNRWARQAIKLSAWHIDLTLLAPGWDAAGYELVDPERGTHRVQIVDIVRD